MPINQIGDIYEATSVIRACPKVTLLRLNLSGPRFQTADGNGSSRVLSSRNSKSNGSSGCTGIASGSGIVKIQCQLLHLECCWNFLSKWHGGWLGSGGFERYEEILDLFALTVMLKRSPAIKGVFPEYLQSGSLWTNGESDELWS